MITTYPQNLIYILLSIVFIALLASLMHFAYNFTNHSIIIGVFTPINESIWEHLKLSIYPTTIWYILYALFNVKNDMLNIEVLIASCTMSIAIATIIIPAFYYTYTGALGIHSLFMDITSLIVGTAIGQIFSGIYFSKHDITSVYPYVFLYSIFVLVFTVFTFLPPRIPLFLDPITNTYSIKKDS